jgi:hypothetical protein
MRLYKLEGLNRPHQSGEMAERFKAAVLKTVERKLRGFESLSLRHDFKNKFGVLSSE